MIEKWTMCTRHLERYVQLEIQRKDTERYELRRAEERSVSNRKGKFPKMYTQKHTIIHVTDVVHKHAYTYTYTHSPFLS